MLSGFRSQQSLTQYAMVFPMCRTPTLPYRTVPYVATGVGINEVQYFEFKGCFLAYYWLVKNQSINYRKKDWSHQNMNMNIFKHAMQRWID